MKLWISVAALPTLVMAQAANERWTVILTDAPVAHIAGATRTGPMPVEAQETVARHARIEQEIAARGVAISSSTTRLLNAVFVHATREQASLLRTLPGVARVLPQTRYQSKMAKALDLISAPAAWTKLGGEAKAGAGVLIGIIDSGIDPNHPVLKDSSLTIPPGYPRCKAADCAYTSNKILVARSYIGLIAVNADQTLSRPDDLSPRDHIGHGTAVAAVAAGVRTAGPAASTAGVAPKAYLGNYKVFGTPGCER